MDLLYRCSELELSSLVKLFPPNLNSIWSFLSKMSPQLISQSAANGPEIGKIYKDLLTFALNPPVPFDEHKPLYIDAENPTRSLSAGRFRALVRTLIAGLRAHGLQNGDCVLVHMGNHVCVIHFPRLASDMTFPAYQRSS